MNIMNMCRPKGPTPGPPRALVGNQSFAGEEDIPVFHPQNCLQYISKININFKFLQKHAYREPRKRSELLVIITLIKFHVD